MNRIAVALAVVESRLSSIAEDKKASLAKAMTLTFEEHFAYQNAQAHAHASGKLSLDEAQMIYTALGEGGGWPEDTSLAMKITITQLMSELLKPSKIFQRPS
jgi:hypothetical protein